MKMGIDSARRSTTTPRCGIAGLTAALGGVLLSLLPARAGADGPQQGERTVTCTNLVSGASWQIKIDFGRGTVDANPARISAAKISWHDMGDGGNYTLDRKSGDLTVIVASSTGGYFLHDHCRLEP
jgi:hypothetical protein